MECSSVVFQEEENAHTEEQMEAKEFPDNADKLHKDNSPSGQEKSPSRQENSK